MSIGCNPRELLFLNLFTMRIIRKTTRIDGYIGMYAEESCAKPSYRTDIYKKTCFGFKLIYTYYMVYHVYRTIGILEDRFGGASVAKLYGEVIGCKYKFMENLQPKSLKRIYPILISHY